VIGFLLSIPGQLKLWGLAVAGVAIALAATWLGGRKSGKTADKIDKLQDEVEAHETRDEVDRDAGTGDAHQRLRDEWSR
jgi:mannose/fructose/N-acetylgalactosamine-specific phosphotransferase system component IIC